MSKNQGNILSKREIDLLLENNPQIGETVIFHRNHPHTSDMFPFLHTDKFLLRYMGDRRFVVVGKEHIPCEEPPPDQTNSPENKE